MTEEREIDLKQLLLVVLMHKKLIVLACVIGCIAGIIYGALKTPSPVVIPEGEEPDEEVVLTVEAYLTEKRYYDIQKAALEKQIAEFNELISRVQTYLQESPTMKLDPYHTVNATAELYVIRDDDVKLSDSGTFILPTDTLRILNAYNMEVVREINSMEKVAEELDVNKTYLNELVSCSVDRNVAVVNVVIYGPDDAFVEKLMDVVLERMQEMQSEISKTYGEHETILVRHEPVEANASGFLSSKQAQLNAVADYTTKLTNAKAALDKLEEPESPDGIEVEEAGETETTTTEVSLDAVTVTGGGTNPKQIAKFGIIGFIGGLFASMFFLALYYILSNKVLSAEEFNSRYRMRAITMLPGTKQTGAKRRIAMHGRDSAFLRMGEEEQYEVAAANLSVYAPGVKDILLTGSIAAPQLQKLAENLGKRITDVAFSSASHINEDASALQALKEHEHVVVVEECLSSNYTESDRAFQTLRDWDKKIIGSIVLG